MLPGPADISAGKANFSPASAWNGDTDLFTPLVVI
jgi:hypothetical protein